MSASPTTSWADIKREVIRRISERIWRPGDLIPGEQELAQEFGCARATVSKAMRELADAGLLERRRKAGTRIAINPVRKATLEIPLVRIDVEGRGSTYRHALLSREDVPPPAHVAARLQLDAATPMLHLCALHLADEQAFAYEDRWVNVAAVPEIADADLETLSANEWLIRNAAFLSGELTLSAAEASTEDAEVLGVAPGAAIFIVQRITWNATQPITLARLAYAPGYRMHTSI